MSTPTTDILQPGEALRVTVDDGKYTVIQQADGRMRALRYGEEWRDLTGDGLICALAHEVESLRAKYAEMFNGTIRSMCAMDDLGESLALAMEDLLASEGTGDMDPVSVAYDNMCCDAKVAAAEKAVQAWRTMRPTKGLVGHEQSQQSSEKEVVHVV